MSTLKIETDIDNILDKIFFMDLRCVLDDELHDEIMELLITDLNDGLFWDYNNI